MTVRLADKGAVLLEGDCSIDDAEPLLRCLLAAPEAPLDWRACDSLHAVVLQVILASGRPVAGPPRSPFLQAIIAPALGRVGD